MLKENKKPEIQKCFIGKYLIEVARNRKHTEHNDYSTFQSPSCDVFECQSKTSRVRK